ncbi:MAG: branched chain amino acid aminotransferase [SAR324 cluster bacterium]|uniref:branched-chain-amino-acid transaminase n=1 Tax=SAR324 cluster bacterium TaxID=2024889 RepID=A0A2A4SN67_9DELT|nr:MAG: branched chain amino acid aminotransferase [SAR324 cluster bacterium]
MSNKLEQKKDLDWASLGFEYVKTDFRFTASYENGVWSEGELITSEQMTVHEGAPALHYSQQCFEGLKAQTTKDGRVLLFRPDLNAQRLQDTADRLLMPQVPTELFLRGVEEAVRANYSWIPPYGSGAALYIRPFLIGVGDNLGLRPAKKYEFRVFVSPVGPYYKGEGLSIISLAVTDVDRAAPKGTGHVKAGSNYAGGLLATHKAKELGANEALYLDAAERIYLEEAGSANILLKMTGGRFVTPKSDAILPSVTRRSIMTIAKQELDLEIEERPVNFLKELPEIEEMAACGTAAVLSPVGKVWVNDQWTLFYGEGEKVGPTMQKLYDLLTQLQKGEREDIYGWTKEVVMD